MKVSKDQHLKAERKCLSAAAAYGIMKCDEGSDAWNNLRISHIHAFLKNLRQHVPRKKNMEFAKVRRKKIYFWRR